MRNTCLNALKLKLKRKKISILISTIIIFIALYGLFQVTLIQTNLDNRLQQENTEKLHNSLTFDSGMSIIENQTITEDIIISNNANVSFINSTVLGSIYVFNSGELHLLRESNITMNIIISDKSRLSISNSTAMGSIECRDISNMILTDSYSVSTIIWKFDAANLTINRSTFSQLNEFGSGGVISIIDSTINVVLLNGIPLSRTFIWNSNINSLIDFVSPLNAVTGPFSFNIFTFNISFSTSERIINLTWVGWDSPIIDGYLNLTFEIYLDGEFQTSIDSSGFLNIYYGNFMMEIPTTGTHNITLISIDGSGNRLSTTVMIEIIEYPNFPLVQFIVVVAILVGVIVFLIIFLKYKEKRNYYSSIGVIFKKELVDNKFKSILFTLIAAGPGIILLLVYMGLKFLIGSISIDFIRSMISIFFTLFIYYFGMGFSIVFAAGTVANAKKDGTLSWFFSKPVRRWEYLWGKVLVYFLTIVITMVSASLSIIIGGLVSVDPIYYPDILSIGGYTFLIGLFALLSLTSIVVLCSTVFKKVALAYVFPIALLMMIPPLIMFMPVLLGHEWPLLLSFTYYYERLGEVWISTTGGIFGSIGAMGELFGIEITRLNLEPATILLILSGISAVCLFIATLLFQKQDIP